jgi:hypothetical protein
VLYEVLATPVTYAVVNFLKRQEGMDPFDYGTDFNPFHIGLGEAAETEAVVEAD